MRSGQATFAQVCLMLFMLMVGSVSAASAAAGDQRDATLASQQQRSETTVSGLERMREASFSNVGWSGFVQGAGDGYYICHATGDPDVFVAMSPNSAGIVNGHLGHQGGRDIIPPIEHRGQWYSQNWDGAPESQAIHAAGCVIPPPSDPPPSSLPLPLTCFESGPDSIQCFSEDVTVFTGTCAGLSEPGPWDCTIQGTAVSCFQHPQFPWIQCDMSVPGGGGGGGAEPVLPLSCTVTSDGSWACADAEGTQFSATCAIFPVLIFAPGNPIPIDTVLQFQCTVGGGATYSCADPMGDPLTTACTELAPAPFDPQ